MNESGRDSARLLAATLCTLVGVIFFVLAPRPAAAATIFNQPIFSSVVASSNEGIQQELGHPSSNANLTTIRVYVQNTGGSDAQLALQFGCSTTSAYSHDCAVPYYFTYPAVTVPAGYTGYIDMAFDPVVGSNSCDFTTACSVNTADYYDIEPNTITRPLNWYGNAAGTGCSGIFGYTCSGDIMYSIADAGGFSAPPASSSQIDTISPLDGSTTASTAVPITITYDLTSTASFDQVGVMLNDITTGYTPLPLIVASSTSGAANTFATTTTLLAGHAYSITAFLQNSVSGSVLQNTVTACQANAGAGSCIFAVESNPLGAALGANTLSASSTFSLATSTCTIVNPTGCVQNALVWALYPSTSMLQYVGNTGTSIKNKPPFGYVFVYIAALQSLNASGTPPVTLAVDTPIVTYIFHPFDVGIGVLFFFFFGVWFVLRIRKIDL